ncbi:hypothetical protein CYMTET_33401 [Cymbomonas tetramitiformis]|uniref:Uncharacterized protein n=1 Tax=Cymbomonas tetramitiformis TaxID=36881 RepID=A0AAE0FD30_9CHLO|nr:hypothetical protein CYMTET_33401 [Cymbomonas tetramitiformis]
MTSVDEVDDIRGSLRQMRESRDSLDVGVEQIMSEMLKGVESLLEKKKKKPSASADQTVHHGRKGRRQRILQEVADSRRTNDGNRDSEFYFSARRLITLQNVGVLLFLPHARYYIKFGSDLLRQRPDLPGKQCFHELNAGGSKLTTRNVRCVCSRLSRTHQWWYCRVNTLVVVIACVCGLT